MPFQPLPNLELKIDNVDFLVTEHPNAPGMPYGQEGRQAIVYQLRAGDESKALKVFKSRYRTPALVSLAEEIASYASLPGLQVCQRTVLTPRRHQDLLRKHPDLTYAVMMPWVEGITWQEVLMTKTKLTANQSNNLARAFADILVTMEERGIAHCDVSGANLMLPTDLSSGTVALVDVEGLYGSRLTPPKIFPAGSPGYAHQTAPQGLWSSEADRFASAVMLAEILGFCHPELREAAWGESYFNKVEMQADTDRYHLLADTLGQLWGDNIASLFTRAWRSDVLAECPTTGEWLVALPDQPITIPEELEETKPTATVVSDVGNLIEQAEDAAHRGARQEALMLFGQAARMASPEMAADIQARINELEEETDVEGEWQCENCGQMVAESMDACPYCEQGLREGYIPVEDATPVETFIEYQQCPHCGELTPKGHDICLYCEKSLVYTPVPPPAQLEPQKKSAVGGVFLGGGIGIGIIIILGIVIMGIIFLIASNSGSSSPTTYKTNTPVSVAVRESSPTSIPTEKQPTYTPYPTLTPYPTYTTAPTKKPTERPIDRPVPTKTPRRQDPDDVVADYWYLYQ